MNLSKIILLVLSGEASAEFIQFANQAEFNKLQPNVHQCNEKLSLNYTMSATSDGYWAVYQYRKEDIDDDLLVEFINCVDPNSRFPVAFENRSNPQNPLWTNRNESTLGPDHVVLTARPMDTGKGLIEDEKSNKVAKVAGARPKRLAAQDYEFYSRGDCNGWSKWHTYASNNKCINLPTNMNIILCTMIHNKGCCESIMKAWERFNCAPGDGMTVRVPGKVWLVLYQILRSFRQIR